MNPMGLATWLRRRAERDGGRPAVTFDGETLTYGELQTRAASFATALAGQGVRPGDRVAYVGFNHSVFLVALFGTARLGAIFVPLNFRWTAPELAHAIGDSDARVVLADAAHAAEVDKARADLDPSLRCLRLGPGAGPVGWQSVDDLLDQVGSQGEDAPEASVDMDEPAAILYTSGTTGRPKGAILTHRNFWTNNVNWMLAVNYSGDDIALTSAPLFHSGGMCVMTLPMLMAGAHVIVHEHFDAAVLLAAIERYKVTSLFLVPSMMLMASQLEQFASADLSSVRIIVAGAAPVPEPMLRLYGSRGIPVSQCWGLTEVATGATFLRTDLALDKLGSCGTAGMLNEVRLIDFDGNLLITPGVHGELCVRGDTVTPGYWNQPEATAAALTPDGWFRTGDVAYQDDDGFFYIADRLKDMIISGGENVYPAEVESVLYGHPAVAEVAVIGASDEKWGERVVAVVVLKPGATLELEDLREFASTSLARFKLPLELRIVSELPRNTTGKVLKHELRSV